MRSLPLLLCVMLVIPATARARRNVVPANPSSASALQVPLSFLSYEKRTGITEYAAGVGTDLGAWLVGVSLRYHLTHADEDQLLRARGPAEALTMELTFGYGGNLFANMTLDQACEQQGLKVGDCVFSNLDSERQELYRKRGPLWDAPWMVLLKVGGSYQQLTRRDEIDRSLERDQRMWGANARLAIGGYLGKALLGVSGGVATLGAPPSQVSYCTALAPTGAGAELACTPAYLSGYNRTGIVDARVEWRQAFAKLGYNPALQAIFQRSDRDDPATANDDAVFGLRYVEVELPVFFYVHTVEDPGFYAGLRGTLRWWNVERPSQVEAMGGFFISLAYGGCETRDD